MRDRWKRWRGYFEELEEAARLAGQHLAEVESSLRSEHELDHWPAAQQETVAAELVRRSLDIPFLRDVVKAAWSVEPRAPLAPPDGSVRAWREGETESSRRLTERGANIAGPDLADGTIEVEPPARLRSAERALAQRTRSIALVFEDLCHPHNASAVMRTADVFGLQEIHFIQPEGRGKVKRAIARSCDRFLDQHWYRDTGTAVSRLREQGYRILAADFGADAVPLDRVELGPKVAVVLGSEQLGVSETMREEADALFYIPTAGFTSYLNVSSAAAIAVYAIDQRMRNDGQRAGLERTDLAALRRAWYVALARGDEARVRKYLAWVDRSPEPAPPFSPAPSREKSRDPDSGSS